MNKTFRTALLAAALLSLVACNSDDETANDLPKGQWLSAGTETDEEGLVTTNYACFGNDGITHSVELEDDAGDLYLAWTLGSYSVSGSELSVNFTEKVDYSGSVLPADLTKLPSESMGEDIDSFTAQYSTTGDKLTLEFMGMSTTMAPVATVPAYMAGISCK